MRLRSPREECAGAGGCGEVVGLMGFFVCRAVVDVDLCEVGGGRWRFGEQGSAEG